MQVSKASLVGYKFWFFCGCVINYCLAFLGACFSHFICLSAHIHEIWCPRILWKIIVILRPLYEYLHACIHGQKLIFNNTQLLELYIVGGGVIVTGKPKCNGTKFCSIATLCTTNHTHHALWAFKVTERKLQAKCKVVMYKCLAITLQRSMKL